MKFREKNTLAYFNAAPQTHTHDFSEVPTSVFAAATREYRKACGMSSPNADAVTFYTLNHCASIVRRSFTLNEPLPEWARTIMQAYTDITMAQGERLMHYLFCITTRETRHMKDGTLAFWEKVKETLGDKSVALLNDIRINGDDSVAVKKYQETPPDMPVGQFVKTIAYGFHHGSYQSHYGGKPWGLTTDALVAMIHGETSMEMLVDTGYTLAHNGGPIFDKAMMYTGYDHSLLTVLDVQRSGQMLDLMLESNTLGVNKTPEAVAAVYLIKQNYPMALKGYMDWKLVDELRPSKDKDANPTKYHKVTMVQKQPMAKKVAKAVKKNHPNAPLASTLMMHGKKVKVTGTWQVFPNQEVTVYERTEK